MMVVTTDVLMRRLLDITIKGSFEISTSLLVVMVFCAVAWVMVVHGHVEVDVFTRRYPKSFQKPLSAIALFLSFIIVALMCWGSIILGLQQLKIGESSVLLKIPVAPFVFTVAVGSALLCLVILIQFIRVFIGGEER
jgi:TRAP-type C4-dicarboxylate transport system permease small subunit